MKKVYEVHSLDSINDKNGLQQPEIVFEDNKAAEAYVFRRTIAENRSFTIMERKVVAKEDTTEDDKNLPAAFYFKATLDVRNGVHWCTLDSVEQTPKEDDMKTKIIRVEKKDDETWKYEGIVITDDMKEMDDPYDINFFVGSLVIDEYRRQKESHPDDEDVKK